MKKTTLNFHKNVSAPRSPLVQNKFTNKTQKNTNTKRSSSTQQKPNDKSKSKTHSTKPKNSKSSQSPAQRDNKVKPKSRKNIRSKRDQDFSDFKGKGKNIYTGKSQEQNYLESLNEKSFENVQALKLNLLGFIFKNRLIKDDQYNELFEHLVEKFPDKADIIKNVLFQIVSTLDS